MYDTETDKMELAPVYDCGSCLYPQADEKIMRLVLESENERNLRIFEIPTSAIMLNGKRIKYFDFISSLQNEDCNAALRRIVPKVDLVRINALVDRTPALTNLQRQFYKTMLAERKRKLLDLPLDKLKSIK